MQFQADVIGTVVERAEVMETTALGAAYLAGLYVGVWKSLQDIRENWNKSASYIPSMSVDKKKEYINKWHKAVRMCQGWEEN